MSVEATIDAENGNNPEVPASQDARSDLGDGSSSLSDIEDKEADQDDVDDEISVDEQGEYIAQDEDEEDEQEDDQDVEMDSDGNDSEAETERLENSPHTIRRHKDVILQSQTEDRTYERSPSKLKQSYGLNENAENDNADDLSDPEGSTVDSPSHTNGQQGRESEDTKALGNGNVGPHSLLNVQDSFSKKRKRSLLPERRSPDPEELEEPARKRTGSIIGREDYFAIDDAVSSREDNGTSGPVSGELSEVDSDLDEDAVEDDPNVTNHINSKPSEDGSSRTQILDTAVTNELNKNRRSKSRRSAGLNEPGRGSDKANAAAEGLHDDQNEEVEDQEAEADNEGDEAEAALRNEEEQEKKRVSLDILSNIQKQFELFKKNLYDERMAQLDREEALLKTDPPSHPQYLEMMKCIDSRRDERLRIEANLTKLRLESMRRTAVAERSQILAQFHQEVREVRERTLEKTGKMWYEIQNDRRGYGSQTEECAINFPTKRSTQIMHHNQYTKEVSLLSGIAKHVGFPAAPKISGVSRDELDADLEKMGKSHQPRHATHRTHQGYPDLSALRAATSTNSFRPAEEQFIEQTPWANPHHPSHAHLIQRQSSNQHGGRTSSPFGSSGPRRQHAIGPTLGLFSSAAQSSSNGIGRASPSNSGPSNSQVQKSGPLSQSNRPPSKSPDEARQVEGTRPDPSKILSATTFPFGGGKPITREHQMTTAGSF